MTPQEAARQYYNTALAIKDQDPTQAYKLLASSVFEDPEFAEGWYLYGNSNSEIDRLPAGVACYRRVLENHPESYESLCNMTQRLIRMGQLDEASDCADRLIKLQPDNFRSWINRSVIDGHMGLLDLSLGAAEEAFRLDKGAEAEFCLAQALLFAGRYADGLRHRLCRYRYAASLAWSQGMPFPLWDGEDLADKHLLIIQDQGMGDALSFMRFVPMVAARARLVEVRVKPELIRLTQMMLASAGCENVAVGPTTVEWPAADFWCGFDDLPVHLGLDDGQIEHTPSPAVPYQSLAASVPWKVPGRRFHVGIAWSGDPRNHVDKWRSIALEQFMDLYKVPGIQLYSLQVGGKDGEIFNGGYVGLVKDMAPYIRDMADTAAIMRDLDLVITVESAVRHIAGVLEVDAWVPYARQGGDWRSSKHRASPLWDPKTKLFRQGDDATWPPVFDFMVKALRERIYG